MKFLVCDQVWCCVITPWLFFSLKFLICKYQRINQVFSNRPRMVPASCKYEIFIEARRADRM